MPNKLEATALNANNAEYKAECCNDFLTNRALFSPYFSNGKSTSVIDSNIDNDDQNFDYLEHYGVQVVKWSQEVLNPQQMMQYFNLAPPLGIMLKQYSDFMPKSMPEMSIENGIRTINLELCYKEEYRYVCAHCGNQNPEPKDLHIIALDGVRTSSNGQKYKVYTREYACNCGHCHVVCAAPDKFDELCQRIKKSQENPEHSKLFVKRSSNIVAPSIQLLDTKITLDVALGILTLIKNSNGKVDLQKIAENNGTSPYYVAALYKAYQKYQESLQQGSI